MIAGIKLGIGFAIGLFLGYIAILGAVALFGVLGFEVH